jgi:hypothetical protein
MEILNAYDLTGSYHAAAELCGCSHHTVKKRSKTATPAYPLAGRRAGHENRPVRQRDGKSGSR